MWGCVVFLWPSLLPQLVALPLLRFKNGDSLNGEF